MDMFGIQEDIILSIRYRDMNIRRADYAKFRAQLSTLSLIPVAIPSKLGNESYQRYHRLGTVFYEEGDSKEFMIQLDEDVVHHIISKEYGYCELNKEAFLACKTSYSQQLYLMLAGWGGGEHSVAIKELKKQKGTDEKESPDIPSILEETKKELDELLESGVGEFSFIYHIEGDTIHIQVINQE